jgi:integrase
MDILVRYKKLDPVNRKYFTDYLRHLQLRNVAETTVLTKLWKVYGFLIWSEFRDLKTARPEDLENFYLFRRTERAAATAFGDIQELKVFFKWLLPGQDLIAFKPQRPRNDLPPEKVLQSDNTRGLLEVCENQRDRALVATFWDSAARLNELLDCCVGDVKFDRYGAVISVNGKTGRRNIRLVSAVPDLQAWLDRYHPLKGDPAAPLFVVSRRRGTREYTRMNERTVQNLFKRLRDLSGCSKKTNPHAFRHGRLTTRGKDLTEAELRQYAGWSSRSAMAAVYVHLSSRDIDDKILKVEGVVQEEEPAPDPMKSRECPRCRRQNAPDAILCDRCSMALTDEGARYLTIGRELLEDPDMMIEYARKKKRDAETGSKSQM